MSQPSEKRVSILPNRESITDQQVNQLLTIVRDLRAFLPHDGETAWPTEPKLSKLDGGLKDQVEATLISTCQRIDSILEESVRWSTSDFDKTLKIVLDNQEAQVAYWKEQALAAATLRRPSYQLKPVLGVVGDKYYAFYGDPTTEGSIIGQGNTPEEAFLHFDSLWASTATQQPPLSGPTKSPEIPPDTSPDQESPKPRSRRKKQ